MCIIFAAPTSPNDQSAHTQSCTLETRASLSTGTCRTVCVLRLSVPAEVGMTLFGMFGMFPVVLSLTEIKDWNYLVILELRGGTKVYNTTAFVLKSFAGASLRQHISSLLKINVVVLLTASMSATIFICYTIKTVKTYLTKNLIYFDKKK